MSESDAETLTYQLQRRNKEIEIIEKVASQINKTLNLDAIAKTMLISMEEYFNFKHSMILLIDNSESVLKVIATHGYQEEGIGAEVKIGVGVIGMVAKKKKIDAHGKHGYAEALHASYKATNPTNGRKKNC